MKKSLYYFGGNTYFEEVLPFLSDRYHFLPAQALDPKISDTILLIPTIDDALDRFWEKIPAHFFKVGLLDHNHFAFNDFQVFERKCPNFLLTPRPITNQVRTKIIPSLHGEMMRKKVKLSSEINREDLFFCSQPLKQDRPELSFNQYDLMQMTLLKAIQENKRLFIKLHPREEGTIPSELLNHPQVTLWEGTMEVALASFSRWFGLNSIALFDAKALGHDVEFLEWNGQN